MKTKFFFALTLTVVITVANTFANFNAQRIFESYWVGYGKQIVDKTTGDYIQLNYDMFNISFDANTMTFKGNKRTLIEIEGEWYTSTVDFTASFDAEKHEVFIQMGNLIEEDVLPYGIKWIHNNMKAVLIPVVEGSFMYQLSGSTVDSAGQPIFEIGFYNEQETGGN